MKLSIVNRSGQLSPQDRDFAERRLRFALSRFQTKVERVSTVISDVNGPKGGIDKSCCINVVMGRLGTVTVTYADSQVETTVAGAAERAGRAVARIVERQRHVDRTPSSWVRPELSE